MTLLCVPITVEEFHRAHDAAEEARRAGADAVEFRFDGVFETDIDADGIEHAVRLARECPLPCVATCRVGAEGGGYTGSEDARAELFEALLGCERPPRWIDIEAASWAADAGLRERVGAALGRANTVSGETRCTLILSTHDFTGRPADLLRRVGAMRDEPLAGVHKIAFRARSLRDNLELFDLLTDRERPTIALAMGEFGLMSRVLAPKFGGFLTFAALRGEEITAPGQPLVDETLSRYRFRSITKRTRVYGVVGWPVAQSMSPLVHNAGFAGLSPSFDGVYLPLPIPPEWEHFKATVSALHDHPWLDLGGLSVTAPHKQHLVRLAQERGWAVCERAARVGAANTLVVDKSGEVGVHDTDGPAVAACLRDALGDLTGRRVLLLGAGGVARTIGAALLEEGASVEIHARRPAQAEELAGALGDGAGVATSPDRSPCDALVNCTPVGMESGENAGRSALPDVALDALAEANASLVVMDTVYRPIETPLLATARAKGLRVVDGVSMFVRQAGAQFSLWTGAEPPTEGFDRIVRERLARPG